MNRIVNISTENDIFSEYRKTPIGLLLKYHNLNQQFDKYKNAKLLIGMCMDNRIHLHVPDNFAFTIRTGGANLRYSEFEVSYAIAVGQVKHIALIGHNDCGMENLISRKEIFIQGLVKNAGWDEKLAKEHFMHFEPTSEIGNEIDFILSEAKRLRLQYPKIQIAPLMYLVENNKLHLVKEPGQ